MDVAQQGVAVAPEHASAEPRHGRSRRAFLQQALAASGAAAVFATQAGTPGLARADTGAFAQAVAQGIAYFAKRNEDQKADVDAMIAAIASRDLVAARRAYVDARPAYEEIETLAACFAQSDADIDARPYAFEGGETSDEFRGFHKVEYLLFRDDDLDEALRYARILRASVDRLGGELQEAERFDAKKSFEGLIALSEEIGSLKISSEEETWSDQSLVIFKSNVIGIQSQFTPFKAMVAERDAAAAEAVDTAYQAMRAVLEPYEIASEKVAMVPYSDVRIGERKAMSDATYRYRDALIRSAALLGVLE